MLATCDHPRAEEDGGSDQGMVDVFGHALHAIATEVVECINYTPAIAYCFAPHLEKCTGKLTALINELQALQKEKHEAKDQS
ncbi:hypothetical protein E2562_029816 [Oryza meyeriana var. granulata]|uniref:Uncharacterized protein n=1 Tax=Oryza meyeriana var. granulata TaxID=110450 RepID=A0A6G1CKH2_9ORYZ|nr:hypothetical protein E2562_029816 [Oryza meyeriana var. granulata]